MFRSIALEITKFAGQCRHICSVWEELTLHKHFDTAQIGALRLRNRCFDIRVELVLAQKYLGDVTGCQYVTHRFAKFCPLDQKLRAIWEDKFISPNGFLFTVHIFTVDQKSALRGVKRMDLVWLKWVLLRKVAQWRHVQSLPVDTHIIIHKQHTGSTFHRRLNLKLVGRFLHLIR